MNKGTKVLFGMLFGQITELTLVAVALRNNMLRPVGFAIAAGLFVALSVFLGIVASGVDSAEEERKAKDEKQIKMLQAQVGSLKKQGAKHE